MAGRIVISDRGFTFIAVLVIIVIMGVMADAIKLQWSTIMQRERETELLFRGQQIKAAIERWNKQLPGQPPPRPLNDLRDLAKDPNSLQTIRYLRGDPNKDYKLMDPITGKEWQVVKQSPGKGIVAVFSSSDATPLKQANFPRGLEEFEGKTKYSDWKFGLKLTGVPGAPGSGGINVTPGGGGIAPGGGTGGIAPGGPGRSSF